MLKLTDEAEVHLAKMLKWCGQVDDAAQRYDRTINLELQLLRVVNRLRIMFVQTSDHTYDHDRGTTTLMVDDAFDFFWVHKSDRFNCSGGINYHGPRTADECLRQLKTGTLDRCSWTINT